MQGNLCVVFGSRSRKNNIPNIAGYGTKSNDVIPRHRSYGNKTLIIISLPPPPPPPPLDLFRISRGMTVTMAVLRTLRQEAFDRGSVKGVRRIVKVFRCACHLGWKIILIFSLSHAPMSP